MLPPSFRATVLRDAWIDVVYQDACSISSSDAAESSLQTRRLYGETARATQHELDHDRGILITDHVALEEMETDLMRSIESPGHDERMVAAYTRYYG